MLMYSLCIPVPDVVYLRDFVFVHLTLYSSMTWTCFLEFLMMILYPPPEVGGHHTPPVPSRFVHSTMWSVCLCLAFVGCGVENPVESFFFPTIWFFFFKSPATLL